MRKVAIFAAVFASALGLAASGLAAPSAAAAPNTKTPTSSTVRVQSGDYLAGIAREEGTNWKRMFWANPKIEDPDVIYAGQQLRVPSAAEQLSQRPITGAAAVAAPAQPTAYAAPAPQPAASQTVNYSYSAPAQPAPASGGVWDQLAACESGGNWSTNTGNGYYGGLQFSQSSWQAVGGTGLPSQASKAEQIARAEQLQAQQGWGAWPACSAKLGL